MLRSLDTAEQAMQMQQVRLDTLANNLANMDAVGFKQVLTRVSEPPRENPQSGPESLPAGLGRTGRNQLNWEPTQQQLLTQAVDVRAGSLTTTGRPTDVALLSEGFFVIQTENGEEYTRNGSFRLDDQRRLVTTDGLPLAGTGGPLTIEGAAYSIERDGAVMVDGGQIGQLRVVNFAAPDRLRHAGNSRLAAPDGMEAEPVAREQVHIEQGMLEGSNVDPVITLVNMIAAQRAFEIESKILQTNDESLDKSINTLGQIS
ncbi:MAG: flagellar hook-basal body protein [bacterium]